MPSSARIHLAYCVAAASFDAACVWDDAGKNDHPTAVKANRAYRIAATWLRKHDLCGLGVEFHGQPIGEHISTNPETAPQYTKVLKRYGG